MPVVDPPLHETGVWGRMPQSLQRFEELKFFYIRFCFPGLEIRFDFRNKQRSGSSFVASTKLFKLPSC